MRFRVYLCFLNAVETLLAFLPSFILLSLLFEWVLEVRRDLVSNSKQEAVVPSLILQIIYLSPTIHLIASSLQPPPLSHVFLILWFRFFMNIWEVFHPWWVLRISNLWHKNHDCISVMSSTVFQTGMWTWGFHCYPVSRLSLYSWFEILHSEQNIV